jgi:hypothetical protein
LNITLETLETKKFRVRNPLNQELHFCFENTLKLTCKHLEIKKFSGGFAPGPPERGGKGEGWGEEGEIGEGKVGEGGEKGEGREGKGRERMWPPSKNPLKKALRCYEPEPDLYGPLNRRLTWRSLYVS